MALRESNALKDQKKKAVAGCPCDSGLSLLDCCQPILAGEPAPTAQVLMRSRYTAFTQHNADYLRYSWHPDTRPEVVDFDPDQRWLGLKIRCAEDGGAHDETGVVCFAARYKIAGRGARLEECSRFVRLPAVGEDAKQVSARWVYLDGEKSG